MGLTYKMQRLRVVSGEMINYCYVIVDNETNYAAVVDPAWELTTITDKLEELGADLKMILLTHSHEDHVDLVPELSLTYRPEVRMSRMESEYYGYRTEGLVPFEDGDRLWLGSTPITCLVTPGHSYGSACFLLSDDLFSGDTVFIEGCGMCSGRGADPEAMFASIQKIISMAPADVLVHPGHSFGKPPGYPIQYLLKNNIYFQFDNKEDFVAFRMRKNQKLLYNFV